MTTVSRLAKLLSASALTATLCCAWGGAAFAVEPIGSPSSSIGSTESVASSETASLANSFAAEQTAFDVANADEFNAAVQSIAAGPHAEATIILHTDVAVKDFCGIADKKITITSESGQCHEIDMGKKLAGDIVLDSVKFVTYSNTALFANGHLFETTAAFQGFTYGEPLLYGGGDAGENVAGDTQLVLRGTARYSYVFGGGKDSHVAGSTRILIDDENTDTGNLTGGGRAVATASGTVQGDTNIELRKGWARYLVGGGRNESSDTSNKEAARVFGDTNVTVGEQGATRIQAHIGTAMASLGGSFYSTVTNTHFTVLPGVVNFSTDASGNYSSGSGALFGAGLFDRVLGTTNVDVRAGGYSKIMHVYGGAYCEARTGESTIENQNGEEYAIRVAYDNDPSKGNEDFPGFNHGINAVSDSQVRTTVSGNVLIDVENADLEYAVLDSENNDSVVNGDAILCIGDGRIAQAEGNARHWKSGAHASFAVYDASGSAEAPHETGYLYKFEKVSLENGSQVVIDGDPAVFPAFSSVQKPFYSVRDLNIEGASKLTTRDSTTTLQGDVTMSNGAWHALGYVYVYEEMASAGSIINFDNFFALGYNYKDVDDASQYTAWSSENDVLVALRSGYFGRFYADVSLKESDVTLLCPVTASGDWDGGNSLLRLPAVEQGQNYDGTEQGGDIALRIEGMATGSCGVLTVKDDNADAGKTAQKPTEGDNYIVGFKAGEASDETFVLHNEDALAEGLYLARIDDPATAENYMWQVQKKRDEGGDKPPVDPDGEGEKPPVDPDGGGEKPPTDPEGGEGEPPAGPDGEEDVPPADKGDGDDEGKKKPSSSDEEGDSALQGNTLAGTGDGTAPLAIAVSVVATVALAASLFLAKRARIGA